MLLLYSADLLVIFKQLHILLAILSTAHAHTKYTTCISTFTRVYTVKMKQASGTGIEKGWDKEILGVTFFLADRNGVAFFLATLEN